MDLMSGDLPPNPFTAIPGAIGDLESGDMVRKQRALEELKQFEADDVASSDRWHELLSQLQGMLFLSPDAPDAPLVRDVIDVHWKWFQRAAPQQAGELTEGVLRAVAAAFASLEFVVSREGGGVVANQAASLVPEVWRLLRLAQLLLTGIAEHFRYLPEALLDSIVVATVALLATSAAVPVVADPARPPGTDDELVELDPAHLFALLDPEGEWFRQWCCRLHATHCREGRPTRERRAAHRRS